ncbi:MAG: phage holin family protein [Clostridiaceae bacterium]|nr:phage holin family protein [Clostridiaceae bacterium]
MANQFNSARVQNFNITHFIIRVVVGAVVLAITAALTRGFTINGFWPLITGAIVLAALDYLALKLLGVNATPFGRGITGFLLAAVIIYVTQFFVAGYAVTMTASLIGALIYGIVDAIIPGRAM